MTARRYASETKVAVDRSLAEIRKLVQVAGATKWSHVELDDEEPPRAYVQFKLNTWLLRFVIMMPTMKDVKYSPTGRYRTDAQIEAALGQEERRRWRELVLLIKAKLVAIESGIVTVSQEMLPYVVLENDITVADWVAPHLDQLQASARARTMPRLPAPVIVQE